MGFQLRASVASIVANCILFMQGIFLCFIILKYIRSKALGLQTLLDRIAENLIVSSIAMHGSIDVIRALPRLFGLFEESLAAPVFVAFSVIMMYFLQSIFSFFAIRYILIYHGAILQDLDENRLLLKIRGFQVVSSFISTWAGVVNRPWSSFSFYNYLTLGNEGATKGLHTPAILTILASLGLMIVLQVRIKISEQPKERWPQRIYDCFYSTGSIELYGINLWRLFALILVVAVLVSKIVPKTGVPEAGIPLFNFLTFNLAPVIVVLNNKNMRNLMVNFLNCGREQTMYHIRE